jgi:carboxypeptidase C (cathepsin A)
MSKSLFAACAALLTALSLAPPGFALDRADRQAPPAEAPAGPGLAPGGDRRDLPAWPPDASVKQSIRLGSGALAYTVTVGTLPVRDDQGRTIADVVFTAYTVDGAARERRPVTFAINGGPGASSVYLNLGALGPKRLQSGGAEDHASDPSVLTDNPATWLGFTDLVFIDPVGTGFSRSRLPVQETPKRFYAVKSDIEDLSRIVYDWLLKNGRLTSPKYLAGESYGGFRAPRMAQYLQTRLGVAMKGLILVSPYLNGLSQQDSGFSPMPWAITLPSLTAANLERAGKAVNREALADVEAYARGEFLGDLVKGFSDAAALDRITARVSTYTGLDRDLVRRSGGRIDVHAYQRDRLRADGKLSSTYDPNITGYDPFPWSASQQAGDPVLDRDTAPVTQAMADYMTRVVGWKHEDRYYALNWDIWEQWDNGARIAYIESVTQLRQAVAIDPAMRVMIAHGYNDLTTPYLASQIIIDQMPTMGDRDRIQLKVYPGGHMFYARPASNAAFRHDVEALYGAP